MNEKPEALAVAESLELHAVIPPGFPKGVAIQCVVSREDLSRAAAELRRLHAENESLRRDAERWRHWRDSHGFATIDHEGGRCFVTLVCDCADPDQTVAKRFAKEDSFKWLDEFTDAAMKEDKR